MLLDEAGHHLRDCGPGEVGLLLIRGPNVFRGYKVAAHNEGLWIQAGEGDLLPGSARPPDKPIRSADPVS